MIPAIGHAQMMFADCGEPVQVRQGRRFIDGRELAADRSHAQRVTDGAGEQRGEGLVV